MKICLVPKIFHGKSHIRESCSTTREKKQHRKKKRTNSGINPHVASLISISMNRTINDKSCWIFCRFGETAICLTSNRNEWHRSIYFEWLKCSKINAAKWFLNFKSNGIELAADDTIYTVQPRNKHSGFVWWILVLFVASVKRLNYKFRICCGNATSTKKLKSSISNTQMQSQPSNYSCCCMLRHLRCWTKRWLIVHLRWIHNH